ncbi:MAG TPA: hypothetical protein VF269_03835 [Rhodanobacteraceae bacterium]
MHRLPALLFCLTLPAATALAAGTPHKSTKTPTPTVASFQRDLVNVLALRAEAKPLLGAALLARTLPDVPDFISYHALLTRAAQATDAGPAITWARLVDCDAKAMDCPNGKALAELEKQAPDNAAVWLMALGQAVHDDHHHAARTVLLKAAAASRYDDYRGINMQALTMAVDTLPPPANLYSGKHAAADSAAGVRALLVFGQGGLEPIPGFHAVARQCAKDKIDATQRATCLQLGKTLAWGSSPLARSLGLHLQQTLSADADARQQAREAWRNLAWQIHNFSRLTFLAPRDQKIAALLLQLARQGGTRMSLILAALRVEHIPVDAPIGWQPGQPAPASTSSR